MPRSPQVRLRTYALAAPNAITNSNGNVTSSGVAPATVDTGWTSQAHFAGDALYKSKDSAVGNYDTTKHTTSLTLVLNPSTVVHGGTYSASGILKDSTTGKVLSAKKITFVATSPIVISNANTDSNGAYKVSGLHVPSTKGSYNIQAKFGGDSLYSSKTLVKTLTVT